MAWNQSGNNGQDHGPWGSSKPGGDSEENGNKGGRDQGPLDLDDIFHKLSKKLGGLGGGKGAGSGGGSSPQDPRPQLGGHVVTITAAAIVIVWAASGFYATKEAERGMVTRFGEFSHLIEPGLNWESASVDEIKPVNMEAAHEPAVFDVVLTSDENVVYTGINVQYRVTNLEKYLYNVTNPDDNPYRTTDSALYGAVGKYIMGRILTEGRTMIRSDTQRELEETIRPCDMSITLLDVNLQATRLPEEVKTTFDDVIAAREGEQQYIREAEACTSEVQPRANGQARCVLEKACTYKAQTILEVQDEVTRLAKLLPKYKAASETTRECLYIETMEKVSGNTRKMLVNDKGGNLMALPLDQMLKGGNAPAAKNDNGASNLLHSPPASSSAISGANNTSSIGQGGVMDQHRVNAQHNDYQRQEE